MSDALINQNEQTDLDKQWDAFANESRGSHLPFGFDILKGNGLTGQFGSKAHPGVDFAGRRFIADFENAHHGWTQWENDEPVARWIERIPQQAPLRAELPLYRCESEWPIGRSGLREDPIEFSIYIPLYNETDDGPHFIYVVPAKTVTHFQAANRLIKDWIPYRGCGPNRCSPISIFRAFGSGSRQPGRETWQRS
jgi:hypothetical protein